MVVRGEESLKAFASLASPLRRAQPDAQHDRGDARAPSVNREIVRAWWPRILSGSEL